MKRGYTLIEVIITISIIAMLTSIVSLGASYYRKTTDKMKNQAILTEIKAFLSFSKSYCREKNQPGQIFIDEKGKYMKMNLLGKEVKVINFNYDFSIGSNFSNQIVDINSEGFITKYGTFYIYKDNQNIGKITIAVSIDTVRVYENDIVEIKEN